MNTLELMHDPDLHKRGIMTKIDHPVRGEVIVSAFPLKMSESFFPVKPSPVLGADNEAIYGAWLGYTPDEVKTLRAREVI
jgi:formyl-CoA transferase